MAGDKFIYDNAGQLTEKASNQTSAGSGDAGKIPALDSTGRLDVSMMPVGVAQEVSVMVASENISAGAKVNIWNDSGTVKARNADATAVGKEANGFLLSSVTTGNSATVYGPSNKNTQLSGLTKGAIYYLDTVAGGITTTAPSATGNLVQRVGKAESTTALVFSPGETWVKA